MKLACFWRLFFLSALVILFYCWCCLFCVCFLFFVFFWSEMHCKNLYSPPKEPKTPAWKRKNSLQRVYPNRACIFLLTLIRRVLAVEWLLYRLVKLPRKVEGKTTEWKQQEMSSLSAMLSRDLSLSHLRFVVRTKNCLTSLNSLSLFLSSPSPSSSPLPPTDVEKKGKNRKEQNMAQILVGGVSRPCPRWRTSRWNWWKTGRKESDWLIWWTAIDWLILFLSGLTVFHAMIRPFHWWIMFVTEVLPWFLSFLLLDVITSISRSVLSHWDSFIYFFFFSVDVGGLVSCVRD